MDISLIFVGLLIIFFALATYCMVQSNDEAMKAELTEEDKYFNRKDGEEKRISFDAALVIFLALIITFSIAFGAMVNEQISVDKTPETEGVKVTVSTTAPAIIETTESTEPDTTEETVEATVTVSTDETIEVTTDILPETMETIHNDLGPAVIETVPETVPETPDTLSDVEMLACVIYQEAGGNESCDNCRRYVADIVLNRVNDPRFPNDIYSVLTAPYQYGRLHWTGIKWAERASYDVEKDAVARAYRIAEEVLSGQHSELYGNGYVWQAGFAQGTDGFWCCGHFYGR